MIEVCKNTALRVSDIDDKEGIVKVYFASFDNVDLQKDVIQKGAFSKTIKERAPKNMIKYVWNHDLGQPMGLIKEMGEDNEGLWSVNQLSKSSFGQDKLIEYREGIIDQHSFQGYAVKQKSQLRKDENVNIITEIMMLEGSAVMLGANPNTPTISVKSFQSYKMHLEKLNQLVKNGDFSDEYLNNLEKQIGEITASIRAVNVNTHEPQNSNNELSIDEIKDLFKSKLS